MVSDTSTVGSRLYPSVPRTQVVPATSYQLATAAMAAGPGLGGGIRETGCDPFVWLLTVLPSRQTETEHHLANR